MKLYCAFIILFCTSNVTNAQTNLDSLWQVWEDESQPDSVRMLSINTYSWYGYLFTQPDSAHYFSQLGYDFGKETHEEKGMVKSLYIQGISFYLRGEYDAAIDTYTKCLEQSKKINYKTGVAQSYNGIGNIYQNTGQYTKAIECYENSLENYESMNDLTGIASVLGNLGIVYKIQGNYALGIEYYNKSLKIHEETGNLQGASSSLNNIAIIYHNQKDFDIALKYYNRSLELDRTAQDKHGEALTLSNIASVYYDLKDYEKAKKYNNKSLTIKKEMNDKSGMSLALFNLGQIYSKLGDFDTAMKFFNDCLAIRVEIDNKQGISAVLIEIGIIEFKKNNYTSSYNNNIKALKISQDIGAIEEIRDASFNLYKVCKILNKKEMALDSYELYISMKDSIENEENQKEIIRLEFKVNYEKQAAADSIKTAESKKVSDAQLAYTNAELDKERTQKYALYGGLILLMFFGVFIYNRFKITQNQKEIIEDQKKSVDEAFNILEEKNTEILDSIKYAKRIQSAILPPDKLVKTYLKNSFILYKPKDIVAGDFYWLEKKEDKILFAAADCTGHGVPGAMISVVCNNGLNRSVREYNLTDPGEILDKTREIVTQEFEKSDEEVRDGMDIALCSIDKNTLQYAGAHNPLWIIRNGELIEIKANKQPIGKYPNEKPYTTHTVELVTGDTIYIFSDGYADQFGGEKNKKFKTKEFKSLLLKINIKSMAEQKQSINKTFEDWKGDLEQLDDVCVIGVRI